MAGEYEKFRARKSLKVGGVGGLTAVVEEVRIEIGSFSLMWQNAEIF